jgi:hypothetical protein
MKHSYKTNKAQECHIEEEKAARPTKDTKCGKPSKMVRKSQASSKTPPEINSPNTFNACSPP